jgi:glucose-6-phosphate isomerase
LEHKNNIQTKFLDKKKIIKFEQKYAKIFKNIKFNLDKSKDTFHILSKQFKLDSQIKNLHKFKRYKTIVIIGMGGSILGSNAIYDLLKKKIKKKFIFFDNLDDNKVSDFKKKYKKDKVLFIVVSKSGNTTETIANFISLNIIKRKAKNIIIISEKKKNLLFTISKKYQLFFVEHKSFLGGRYSVLSEVGLVPAYLMGLDIYKLRNNLQKYIKSNKKIFLRTSTIILANLLSNNKFTNLIFLNYVPELNKFLYWCQQLIAESLGKDGKGFMPVVSNAPKDHHSLLQLYLDGPKDKIFYIFGSQDNTALKLNTKKISKNLKYINNKNINKIKRTQKEALLKTLKKNNIPYREFMIKNINEKILGELFSYFILETAIIGKLINIDPFNQPAVEQVKNLTKKLLS